MRLRSPKHLAKRFWIVAAFLIITAALALDGHTTAAHGYILRSIPADRGVLSRSPSRLQIWFSENLEAKFSSLSLADQHGTDIPLTENGVSATNPALLSAKIPSALPDGAYVVTIRAAFASDGHVGVDTLIFWEGQQTGNVQASQTSQDAVPLEVVWRILTTVSLDVMFGVLVLYSGVLLGAWGNRRYSAGELPPRVLTRLNVLIIGAAVVGLVGSTIALLEQSMTLFNADLPTVLRGDWLIVMQGTQFGDYWTIRTLLIILIIVVQIAAILVPRYGYPVFVKPLWWFNVVVSALALGTLSFGSHAAGSTLWPVPSIMVDWLHVLANAAWVGGLIGLAAVLPVALAPLTNPDERRLALLAALRRFSVIGVVAVVLLITTGVYAALLYVRQPSDLPDTNYGQTLILKVLLIVPLLLIALYHHAAVTNDRLARLFNAIQARISQRIRSLLWTLRAEAVVGVGVLMVAAVLSATPPPVPPDARAAVNVPSQEQTVNGLDVKLSLDPGATGSNSYELDVTRNNQPVAGAQVSLQFSYPTLDTRSGVVTLDDTGEGSYIGAGPELDRAGNWDALVDVTLAGQPDPIRAAYRWQVPDTAPGAAGRQASLLNWLSALSIVIVLGVWLWPGTVSRVRSAQLKAEGVVVGVGALVITLIMTGLGGWLLSNASQQTDALRNPPPVVINPILPDMTSMNAGKALYTANCASCHGMDGSGGTSVPAGQTADQAAAQAAQPSTPVPDLRVVVPQSRDAELYQAFPHSFSPATLSDTDRWNLINFLRSFAIAGAKPQQ